MRVVVRNLGGLLGAQVVTWTLTLLLTVVVSRALGPSATGMLQLGASLWALVALPAGAGFDVLMVREIARRPAGVGELFGAAVRLRGLLSLLGLGVLLLYVSMAPYGWDTRLVVCVIAIGGLVTQLGEACRATLQGLERMGHVALASIASKAFTTAVTLALLALGYGVLGVAAVTIAGAIVYVIVQVVPLVPRRAARLRWNGPLARHLLRGSVPYLATAMALVAYQQVDVVVISLLVDTAMVGWYGAAEKLFRAATFFPAILVAVVFPVIARLHGGPPDLMAAFMRRSVRVVLLVAAPVGLGVAALAEPLVLLIFGDGFAPSGPVLAVLGIAILVTYPNVLLAHFLMATDRQDVLARLLGLALVATIALDLVLVPWCQRMYANGALGGALAYVVTEAGILVACRAYLPAGTVDRSEIRRYLGIGLAGIIAAAVAWWLRHHAIAVPVGAAALAYGALALVFRVIPAGDWQALRRRGTDVVAP